MWEEDIHGLAWCTDAVRDQWYREDVNLYGVEKPADIKSQTVNVDPVK